jgi:tetratricopeptide (TPR) repeat protein
MPQKRNNLIVLIVVCLLILIFSFQKVFFSGKQEKDLLKENEQVTASATSTADHLGVKLLGEGDFVVEPVTLTAADLMPDLNRPIVFSNGEPAEFRRLMKEKIERSVAELKIHPEKAEEWNNLAIFRKNINDYEAAAEIWEYLVWLQPTNVVALGNLGDLYHFYLRDYPKSEKNFLAAIALEPTNLTLYRGLHELYRYSYKRDTSAAADILKTGLQKIPDNIDLLVLLASYYKEKGQKKEARLYYEKALAGARVSGNTALVDALERDLAELR